MRVKFFALFGFAVFFTILGFVGGWLFYEQKIKTMNLYIANTVGNNLSEINRLYSLIPKSDGGMAVEQKKYNIDMLLIVDCSEFFQALNPSTDGASLTYFVKGIDAAWQALYRHGVRKSDLLTCNGEILKIIEDK